jgi:glycosyltransferase involved in cell wall biosynthesis
MPSETYSRQRRILFVAHSSGLYGAEKSLLDIVVGLRQRGWTPLVVVPTAGAFATALEKEGVSYVIQLHKAWIGDQPRILRIPFRVLVNLHAWWNLRRKLAGKCDLVYTNTVAKPLGLLLAASLKVPHVLHVREFVEADLGQNFDFGKTWSLGWAGRKSTKVICNSRAVLEGLSPFIPASKLNLVYNGLLDDATPRMMPRTISPSSDRPLRLCMVGHLDPHKGHGDAIRAAAILNNAGRETLLQIAGAGSAKYRDELMCLADELRITNHVDFLGYRNDAAKVFEGSDVHLVCSQCEAFGRVAVESMALGVPVVGSRSGGLPEIVLEGTNGLLYAPGDAEDLARKISSIADNSDMYARFSAQGQDDVYAAFASRQCIDSIEDILCEAMAKESIIA